MKRTELEKDFGVVCFLEYKNNTDKDFKLGNDLKMQLFGLHKIATEGPYYEPREVICSCKVTSSVIVLFRCLFDLHQPALISSVTATSNHG
ncbi:hypothetical protein HRI_002404400 [Hibiscus trionum]|uniref:Uncharacterized protein n=1 Tax=Hibiscus trionum TaxID=183268 RepID=A0A9W7M4J9_HIBTR|nr:hypothetical protein HRI_002404400 [Hibiscus trionum]